MSAFRAAPEDLVTILDKGTIPGMGEADDNGDGSEDAIAPSLARQIDDNLKRLYGESSEQDLPSNLVELLKALRHQDTPGGSGDR